jgi:hypothetical protein
MALPMRTTRRGDGVPNGMNDPLAEAYLHWLVEQVRAGDGHQTVTYWDVLRLMHETEFVWLVPNDDNRIQDGLDLRADFLNERQEPEFLVMIDRFGPCSILEVMIGLSRRLAFAAGGEPEGWAWQLLCNLDLRTFRDPLSRRKASVVAELLHSLIWRTYAPDGTGGFFPLAWPKEDQTKVELWYQMSAYVEEIHPEY